MPTFNLYVYIARQYEMIMVKSGHNLLEEASSLMEIWTWKVAKSTQFRERIRNSHPAPVSRRYPNERESPNEHAVSRENL